MTKAKTKTGIVDVGAPDPSLKNSPIVDEVDYPDSEYYGEFEGDPDDESPACYFNEVSYQFGQYVHSGRDILHCEKPGIWIRKGELAP